MYIFWGIWGDIAITLIQRGLHAPQAYFFSWGDSPKKWGAVEHQIKRKTTAN